MTKVVHRSITAVQSFNDDVVMFKNGRMVMHINYTGKLKKENLKDLIEEYYSVLRGV